MNKFSLIDLFSKIASNKEAVTTITNVISNLVEKGTSNNKNTVAKNIPTQKKDNVHSKTAIISLMEKHDKLSREIDLKEKNKIK